jgi:chromosome segregation ATPase
MMGSGSDDGANIYDLLALVDDKAKYEAKLRELDKRSVEARTTLEQATAQNAQAELKQGLAREMLAQASLQLKAANDQRDQNVRDKTEHAGIVNDHAAEVARAQDTLRKAHDVLKSREEALAQKHKFADDLVSKLQDERKEFAHHVINTEMAHERRDRDIDDRKASIEGHAKILATARDDLERAHRSLKSAVAKTTELTPGHMK